VSESWALSVCCMMLLCARLSLTWPSIMAADLEDQLWAMPHSCIRCPDLKYIMSCHSVTTRLSGACACGIADFAAERCQYGLMA
jgi:hypothetical protein